VPQGCKNISKPMIPLCLLGLVVASLAAWARLGNRDGPGVQKMGEKTDQLGTQLMTIDYSNKMKSETGKRRTGCV
jgi:hypothetical protein